jgi:hypothetical protein
MWFGPELLSALWVVSSGPQCQLDLEGRDVLLISEGESGIFVAR